MPVLAVINRKGGSGKSTLAAHVAAWCAHQGHAVMLGDVDRQQSTRSWLRRRDAALPAIAPWAVDQRHVLRLPTGITHVVLDTPGGLQGFELARVVMFSDALLLPVCPSVFDREAAAACIAELQTLPRVASGRCRLAVVGMRVDGRTRGAELLAQWAEGLHVPFLGALRETQVYVRCLERGLTLFDLPGHKVTSDLAQWSPILDWLAPVLNPPKAANDGDAATSAARLGQSRPVALMPAQDSLVHGGRLASVARLASGSVQAPRPVATLTTTRTDTRIPHFLRSGG